MNDRQNFDDMREFRNFHTHAYIVNVINEQRMVFNSFFKGHPEVFNILLEGNNELRHVNIELMLDDSFVFRPSVSGDEYQEELKFIERVLDLADIQSAEQFEELVKLLWIHLTSDEMEESNSAKERIEMEFIIPGKKYAFVLDADSRGLDEEGLALLENYVIDRYAEDSGLVFIEDKAIGNPSYLAEKIAGGYLFDDNLVDVSDCYVFVLHDDKHSMECITGKKLLYSLTQTLLNNKDKLSWSIAMMYVMVMGIEPVSIRIEA